MARFLDDLRRGAVRPPWFVAPSKYDAWEKHAVKVLDILQNEMPCLHIPNVAEYFYQSDQEYWDLKEDFPNLAPPWPQFWSEHPLPNHIYSKEKGLTDLSDKWGGGRLGVLTTSLDPAKEIVADKKPPEECKWLLWFEVFIDYRVRKDVVADGPHGSIFLMLDKDGVIIERPWMQTYSPSGEPYDSVMRDLMTFVKPTCLAMCFMHCRNVRVVDNKIDPKLVKRHRERHEGQTPTGFKTLIIDPLKEILRKEGNADKVGLAKAMHICRGHFRDYREGKGLFGKYHAMVWTPMTVRGSKKRKIVRDIDVEVKI